MNRRGAACLVLACAFAPGVTHAQSLADAARSAGVRKSSPSTLVFDGRDLDPDRARQELLDFSIAADRWPRYLEANKRLGQVFAADPSILRRFKGLQATSVRSLERFLQREPSALAALASADLDPHEFAFTHLATGLAADLIARGDAAGVGGFPPAVQSNVAFVRRHKNDIAALRIGIDTLALRISAVPGPRAVPDAPELQPASAPEPPRAIPPAAATDTGPRRQQVPDFTFVDFNGAARQLSDFRGRFVLLDFWGVWCPNCRAEVPYLKEAYAQFQSRGLEIIGMDYEKGATVDEVRRYLATNGITWTFARPDSVREVIRDQFQVDAYPTLMLVDPEGGLVETPSSSLRGARLFRTLDRYLPGSR